MPQPRYVPLAPRPDYPPAQMLERAALFRADMQRRRTVRHFSSRPIDRAVIEECILAAGSAPSGANMQPWHFVVVSDPSTKSRIREGAEHEEREFYHRRASAEWLAALEPLGTDEHKPFLEEAPYLIVIFAESHGVLPDGRSVKNYYVSESVGIATGVLITGLHLAGLATLTHTPSPMGFLNTILGRPANERPYLVLVVGYPTSEALVPEITKKRLSDMATFV